MKIHTQKMVDKKTFELDLLLDNITDANRHPEFNSNDVKEAQSIFKQSGSNSESFVDEFLEKKYQEANKENSNLKKYEINTCTKQL